MLPAEELMAQRRRSGFLGRRDVGTVLILNDTAMAEAAVGSAGSFAALAAAGSGKLVELSGNIRSLRGAVFDLALAAPDYAEVRLHRAITTHDVLAAYDLDAFGVHCE